MQRNTIWISFVATLLMGGSAAAAGPSPTDTLGQPVEPLAIYGGEPAGACEFPSAGTLGSCTATLVHPQLITYAAHCGTNYSSVKFADDANGPGITASTQSCRRHPSYNGIGTGTDFAYCTLSSPVEGIVPTPPLMGCEVDVLTEGKDVWIVGFGNNDDGGYGRKYKAHTSFNYFDSVGDANIGSNGVTVCQGDSGGPAYVQLPTEDGYDGSWRAFGIASYIYTPCGNEGFSAVIHRGVDWIEEDSGIDITPCHDADGTWNPGEDCTDFPLQIEIGSGSWDSACAPGDLTGYASTCGPSYAETLDGAPPRVTITSPENGATIMTDGAGASVTASVDATDQETNIVSVELFIDGVSSGPPLETPPYSFDLQLAEGDYALTAVAIDEAGNEGEDGPVEISITGLLPEPPEDDGAPEDDESRPEDDDDPPEDDDDPPEDDNDDPDAQTVNALPPGFGGNPDAGCSCHSGGEQPGPGPFFGALGLFGLLARRRPHGGERSTCATLGAVRPRR